MLTNTDETSGLQGGIVVGQAGDAKPGEDAKCEVQKPNQQIRGNAHSTRRNGEVSYDPEGSRSKEGRNLSGDLIDFRLYEAVEEEVGDDEVILDFRGRGKKDQGVGLVCAQDGIRRAVVSKKFEHDTAGIDSVGLQRGILSEEACKEAAVAVAKYQRGSAIAKFWEEVKSGPLERASESHVLEPAVGTGDEIEVWLRGFHEWRVKTSSMGVRRQRSAAARRAAGSRCLRLKWSCSSSAADRDIATSSCQGAELGPREKLL